MVSLFVLCVSLSRIALTQYQFFGASQNVAGAATTAGARDMKGVDMDLFGWGDVGVVNQETGLREFLTRPLRSLTTSVAYRVPVLLPTNLSTAGPRCSMAIVLRTGQHCLTIRSIAMLRYLLVTVLTS